MSDYDFTNLEKFSKHFTNEEFWTKVKKYAQNVGIEGLRYALYLWYTLDLPSVPAKTKAVIYGALGYFILPVDLIPDVVPVLGYSDDIAALAAAVAVASFHINQDVRDKAEMKLHDWFGDNI